MRKRGEEKKERKRAEEIRGVFAVYLLGVQRELSLLT